MQANMAAERLTGYVSLIILITNNSAASLQHSGDLAVKDIDYEANKRDYRGR